MEQMEGTRADLAQKLEALENQVVGTIQDATSTVSETVHEVKEAVTGTVETVKQTVEGTVDTVKETVQGTVETVKETFDVRRQVENHPWLMFGGSLAAGFVAGRLLQRYGPEVGMPTWQGFSSAVRHFPDQFSSMTHPSHYTGVGQSAAGYPYESAQERREEPAPQPETREQQPGLLESLTSTLAPEMTKLKGLAIGAALGLVRDLITQKAPPEIGSQLADMVNDFTSRLGGQVFHEPILQTFTGDRSQGHTGSPQHDFATGSSH
jgi:ElaB/YqjD/DUF883 family membrane-anchored ribosome-binding protein